MLVLFGPQSSYSYIVLYEFPLLSLLLFCISHFEILFFKRSTASVKLSKFMKRAPPDGYCTSYPYLFLLLFVTSAKLETVFLETL